MGFFSPWFLGGLLAVGLPIYVHLLRQHRSEPVKFSSVMFLERRTQSSVKHRRLKYLALLAMRLAIVVLLALMFANPFIRRSQAAADAGRKLVVVAVDNSFSMRAGDRLGQAKQQALSTVRSLRAADRGQVVWFASGVQVLTQPTNDRGELERAVAGIEPGDGRSAYGEIARWLRAAVEADGLAVEAHIFTDAQRTSMPAPFAELAVPPSMALLVHPVADGPEPNWFVESVNAPRSVFQPKQVRVQATVAGAATEQASVAVELRLNGRTLERKQVAVPGNGRASVEFYLPDAQYGLNRGEVRVIKGDVLPQDDVLPFSLERKEASKVLFVYQRNPRALTYYRSALESVPDAGYTVEPVTVDQLGSHDLARYAGIILSDVFVEGPVAEYARRGGGVLVAVGPTIAARGRTPLVNAAIADSRYASRAGDRFLAAGSVDATHPAVARAQNFEAVKFYQAYAITPGEARVVASLTDGTPLLMEQKLGAGRVLVFASTLDNVANDLPLHASFIPFIEQVAHYLAGVEATPATYIVDSFLDLRSTQDAGASVEVLDPEGKRALTLKEAASSEAFRLTREGFYEVQRGNGRNELIAVHADRRESNLDVVPADTLALWQSGGVGPDAGGVQAAESSKPYSLWWYFALALLIASVVESLFSSRYLAGSNEAAAPRVTKAAA